jgi:hypothetical protein
VRCKEAAGKVLGDKKLETEGKTDKIAGKARLCIWLYVVDTIVPYQRFPRLDACSGGSTPRYSEWDCSWTAQWALPGSPGAGTVYFRHSSLPILASRPASQSRRPAPLAAAPMRILSLIASGAPVCGTSGIRILRY